MAHFGHNGGAGMAPLGEEEEQTDHYHPFGAALTGTPQNDFFFTHQTVLNHEEQEYMNQFWDNPNNSFGHDAVLDSDGFMDPKTNSGGGGFGFGNDGLDSTAQIMPNPAVTAATNSSANYETHSDDPHLPRHVKNTGSHVQDPRSDSEQYAAASSLFGMAGQGFSPAANNGGTIGSTWGDINVPTISPMRANEGPSQLSSGSPSTNYTPSTPTYPPFNSQLQRMMDPELIQYLRLQQQSGSQGRPGSLHFSPTTQVFPDQGHVRMPPPLQSQTPGTKPSMMFGSDQDFTSSGYSGQFVSQEQDKGNNLLGVPFLNQAAAAERPQLQGFVPLSKQQAQNHQQNFPNISGGLHKVPSSSNGLGGLPHVSPPSTVAQAYPDSRTATRSIEKDNRTDAQGYQQGPPSRKRRKSNTELEDEAEYVPPLNRGRASDFKRGARLPKSNHSDTDDDEYDGKALPTNNPSKRRKSSNAARNFSDTSDHRSPSALASESPVPPGIRKRSSDVKARNNLTEDQKRDNHIKSEQRRRNLIKDGYADIERLVPSLKRGKSGLSKSDALFEAVKFIEKTAAGNAIMEERFGIRLEVVYHFSDEEANPRAEDTDDCASLKNNH